ncbi:MAG TPA: RagB/SusD family nutrient uptake outer membrane protein [Mariniphaga sp.]|nr:RagB/SusD family nutrient uptake outer membrane protein [Mariniphaga sp.]
MKRIFRISKIVVIIAMTVALVSCHDLLDEPTENTIFTEATDYTISENIILPLVGVYGELYDRGWENHLLIAVRGDDVNHGGLGDQQDYAETDFYRYNKDFWMYNAVWQGLYSDIFIALSAMDEFELYRENGASPAIADQYVAEAKVVESWLLFQVSRVWGDVLIPVSTDPSELLLSTISSKQEVMEYISSRMDEAIPSLPAVHPNERTDLKGGVTRFTALAVKALANLELENYQAVADATSQIISSGHFSLFPDFYNLFKIPGKLADENLLEFQYSDFGQGSGTSRNHNWSPYGPQSWTPLVEGVTAGWGFFEPSLKWIKFMLDRGERIRLETSVLFTNSGIEELKSDPNYSQLPGWISNVTPSGDIINDFDRAIFSSGKHYLPSNQLTPGRTTYGSNKNWPIIRYAEILLMHAEALTRGATSTVMTADDAVNLVRERAGLTPLTGVTADQVMEEKFAELAMEWGIRYYDMIRLETYNELSYDGRTFNPSEDIYLPYPQNQVDLLPILGEE